MIRHFLISTLFFLSIFISPWYITVILALTLIMIAPGYEIIIGGMILDFLYGVITPSLFFSPFSFTIFFLITYIFSHFIKKRLVIVSK